MRGTEIRATERMGAADYGRQRAYYDPARHGGSVMIVGAGGIGSPTALGLAKLGIPRLSVIDFDSVETHNIPSQMFAVADTGESKVQAVCNLIGALSPITEAVPIHGKVMDDGKIYCSDQGNVVTQSLSGIVIGALDNMASRAHLWQAVGASSHVDLYIDGRLGGQQIVVYAVNPRDSDQVEFYESTLHTDEEGVELPCSERAVIDVGLTVAALITRAVRLHLTNDGVEPVVIQNQQTLTITKGESK